MRNHLVIGVSAVLTIVACAAPGAPDEDVAPVASESASIAAAEVLACIQSGDYYSGISCGGGCFEGFVADQDRCCTGRMKCVESCLPAPNPLDSKQGWKCCSRNGNCKPTDGICCNGSHADSSCNSGRRCG
jgi:hypothetical protein